MTREQIEKAAIEYAEKILGIPERLLTRAIFRQWRKVFADAFKNGAEWSINSVWHSPDELPRIGSYVVSLYEDGYISFVKVRDYANSVPVKTWAYIDDLLPETKEGGK